MKPILLMLSFTVLHFLVVEAATFWDDFFVTFGDWNVKYPGPNIGSTVELAMTQQSGTIFNPKSRKTLTGLQVYLDMFDVMTPGSGFRSKYPFLFGEFSINMKLMKGNTAGTVTTFYMASLYTKWCEVDFEFLGNLSGDPYTLQTNVFAQGKGDREQKINLWFDPTADYHKYGFLWNQAMILFMVDNIAIRVFHNSKDLGVPYLDYQPMYVHGSLWNGDSWATRGGTVKIDWSQQPFIASYTGWDIWNSCQVTNITGTEGLHACYKKLYQSSYGRAPNLALSWKQIGELRWVRSQYLISDYCTATAVAPPECARNWP